MNYFGRFLVLVGFCVLGACADQVVTEKKVEVKQDRVVGRVASVYQDGGYLLIQRYGSVSLSGDKVFYVRGGGDEMSSLKVTGERLGQFIAADIVNGEPKVGDAVYERVLDEVKDEGDLGDEIVDEEGEKKEGVDEKKEVLEGEGVGSR